MAIIYRYEIVSRTIREIINLKEYETDIINSIKDSFNRELKDCTVYEKYYEFKLYRSLSNSEKREFGKKILNECINLKYAFELQNTKTYFRRMKQSYYAFFDNENNETELIDAVDFKNMESLLTKSKLYLSGLNIGQKNSTFNDSSALQISLYMDTFSLKLSDADEREIYNRKKHASHVLLLEGNYSSHQYNEGSIIIDEYELNTKFRQSQEGFSLKKISVVDENKINEIQKALEVNIEVFKSKTNPNKINKKIFNKKKINFEVYNVGQALCSSLSGSDFSEVIFFDFGASGEITEHSTIERLISRYPPIFLSHIHRDHWNGINLFKEAFKCHWYIPDQDMKIQFKKKYAEIILSGGKVQIIKNDIALGCGKIVAFLGSNRVEKHETGNILHVRLNDKNNDLKNILVAGDQVYSNIDKEYKEDLDVLIASHHGGTYSKTTRQNYTEIPFANENAVVVYSANNTPKYFHPSYTDDYKKRQWITEHRTYIDGDYKFGSVQ